ncbi:unnamed protein product [Schistosoma turkestanicum]|nr:unnamed protein product [Schistosoma turkestanicum]
MPSLTENSKRPNGENRSTYLNPSHNCLSSNDTTFQDTHVQENQISSEGELRIKNSFKATDLKDDLGVQLKPEYTSEASVILSKAWTRHLEPTYMYIKESDDFYNQSKQQICILECNLRDSEEIRGSVREQDNRSHHTPKKQNNSLHCQQDRNNDSDLLHKQINELTEHETYKIKWIEKCNEFESEIKELKRSKDKAVHQNFKYEEQITELKSKLNSKQEQIRNLLIELEQSNQRLNEIETQFNRYKSQTNQNEENYRTLSHEFTIMKQCKEQAELNAKNCENNRLLYEKRMKELDDNYEQSKQRYYDDVQGLMKQLDMERSRADELLQKIEQNRRQNEEQLRKIEQSYKEKVSILVEDGQKELRRQLAKANEQIKAQEIQIFNQELKISTMDSDNNELIKINRKSTDEQLELREQIKSFENLLTVKDQDVSMLRFECHFYADKLKQIELEKNHFIEKERFMKQRYKNKAKRAWEQCQTIRTRLNRKLVQLRCNRDLLSKHLKKKYEQMNRLNNLFWETGWAYVQSQNSLQNINRQEKECKDQEIQTILVNNKIKQPYATIDQIVQTNVLQSDNDTQDDTVISCAISWISNDLDNLTEKLEKLLKCQGKENLSDPDLHNEEFSEKVSLISMILGMKCKVNWLGRCCDQLTGRIFKQNSELSNKNDLTKFEDIKKDFESSTRNLKLILSQMETDALEDKLSCVGQLAQTTANQLKLSHLRLEENLDSIRTDLIRLRAECH